MSKALNVAVTGVEKAEFIETEQPDQLGPNEVRGRTLCQMKVQPTSMACSHSTMPATAGKSIRALSITAAKPSSQSSTGAKP